MKNLIFAFAAIFLFTLHAHAQQNSCIVKDGNGASVTITVVQTYDDGKVDLSVSSDCNDFVNVNYTLTYRMYYYNEPKGNRQIIQRTETSQPFNVLAQPQSSTSIPVKINLKPIGELVKWEVEKININGARCENK